MWKFSNLNSGYNLWPPDIGQQQLNPDSSIFQRHANPIDCFFGNSIIPFSGFGVQGSPLRLNSNFISPLNSQVFNPANSSSGVKASTPTKRLLVFDLSGDQRNLIFSSVANPFQTLNPTLPSSHGSYAFASNSHGSDEEQEEMHEDTEEIDALLYSDSEFSFDSEEASTGHSPLNMKDEEITSSPTPAKRRKLNPNYSAIDESLMDTASSARASNFPKTPLDGNADISYVESGSNLDNESRDEGGKRRGRIQTIVKALRRIIPGGDAMDTAAVLDEAIRYLKFLKLQANSMDATNASI